MKAVLFDEYGSSDVLRYADMPDPKPGDAEVLVRMVATSVNPIDYKIRSGAMKGRVPIELPSVPGVDVSGIVEAVGPGVTALSVGDRVMGLARRTYAELCVVGADALAAIPDGMGPEEAASLPCVALTGEQLVRRGAKAQPGQTILVTGALGSVGRSAVFAASGLGCRVVAGVRGREAGKAMALPGVDAVVALDDDAAIGALKPVDCVADTVGGEVAAKVIRSVRDGGIFGTVVSGHYGRDGVEVNLVFAQADAAATRRYAEAVRDGRLAIPRGPVFPLARAAEAQDAVHAGGVGKIVLTVSRPR